MLMGYEQYRAKRTFYKGIWFDSNLEARTAEALDALGIQWQFHADCFRDSRFPYNQYTPDFKLADGRYIEVAGFFDERHEMNARVLSMLLGAGGDKPMLIVVDGNGDCKEWFVTSIGNGGEEITLSRTCYQFGPDANIFKAAGLR